VKHTTSISANSAPVKAFFNIILRDLGIKDVKVQELFTLDQESLDILPYVEVKLYFETVTNSF
jgi:hypothetical protein